VLKLDKRYSNGFTMNGSYVFSKLLSNTDSYDADNRAADHYNRSLEKSIGQYDQTHIFKWSYVVELPFGRGRRWLNTGVGNWVLGGWRLSGFHLYASGFPIPLTIPNQLSIFNGRTPAFITTYEGWVANRDGADWRGASRFFNNPSTFAVDTNPNATGIQQPNDRLGNATRYNPKARYPWDLDESFSLGKSFPFTESIRLDLRVEVFNAFNRTRFNPGTFDVQSVNFGVVTSTLNDPRRMQFGLKLYW
jgi:hypothetical protein